MDNKAKTMTKRSQSRRLDSALRRKSPFRDPRGRSSWLAIAALVDFFLVPAVMCSFPDRLLSGAWADRLGVGCIVFFFGMIGAAVCLGVKDRAALIAATLNAPEEKDLLTYIWAFFHDGDKVQAQVAPIICELLGRLSEDELACIPQAYWNRLCPLPEKTPSGYPDEKKVGIYDSIYAAGFSAIMRSKRIASLPCIDEWMGHLKANRHSGAFVRTLHECYYLLHAHQDMLPHSSTLLRPASAEAASPEKMLRPVMGTQKSETETGKQLLRASTGQNSGVSNKK